jgi:pimeloyl-ACP methyl ester carboxylesterase
MKKCLSHLLSLFILSIFIGMIPFLPTDTRILSVEEQVKLKAGKTFWEWEHSNQPYSMHYIEKGTGSKHILLIHGFRANTFTWRYLIDPLAEAGYHVWAIDLIGYGLSDKPSEVPYDLDFFLDQIQAFMKGKQILHAHLIGNSMGGGLAIGMALHHPEKVDSLTLISALGYPLDLSFYLIVGKNFGNLLTPFLGPTMIRQGMSDIVYDKKSITNEQIEAYSLPYQLPGGTIASTITLEKFDNQKLEKISQRYKEIKKPLLVIWGEHDKLIPVSHYHRFAQDFPSCEKLLIQQCGHIPQEETPEAVIAKLLDFLNKQTNLFN